MKIASLQDYEKRPILKVVKGSLKNKSVNKTILINTLISNFSFKNKKGKVITTFNSML